MTSGHWPIARTEVITYVVQGLTINPGPEPFVSVTTQASGWERSLYQLEQTALKPWVITNLSTR